MRRRPRRISLEGVEETSPSTSGATIAGQKKRRNMNAPTAVNFASGNRLITAEEICYSRQHDIVLLVLRSVIHNVTDSSE